MVAVLSADVSRQLLPLLDAVDVSLLCAACRTQQEQLKFLETLAVKFRRDLPVEEAVVTSLQQTLGRLLSLRSFSLCLAYQTSLQDSICRLADSLSKHQLINLTLDLRRCGIGDVGVQACAKTLSVLRLQHLDLGLSFNKISSRGADDLSQSLGSSLADVFLHLDINFIGHSAAKLLSAVLNAGQAHIDLAHCGLDDAVALDLANTLESHASLSGRAQRIHLDLRGNVLAKAKAHVMKAAGCLTATGRRCIIQFD